MPGQDEVHEHQTDRDGGLGGKTMSCSGLVMTVDYDDDVEGYKRLSHRVISIRLRTFSHNLILMPVSHVPYTNTNVSKSRSFRSKKNDDLDSFTFERYELSCI